MRGYGFLWSIGEKQPWSLYMGFFPLKINSPGLKRSLTRAIGIVKLLMLSIVPFAPQSLEESPCVRLPRMLRTS